MLDGFQAGLAWIIVLRKREAFREAFAASIRRRSPASTEDDIVRLLGDRRHHPLARQDRGDDRRRAGLSARWRRRGEDFADFCWSFTDGKPRAERRARLPADDAAVRTDLEGAEAARLQIRRPDDRLCLDAGRRHRQRSRRRLLPADRKSRSDRGMSRLTSDVWARSSVAQPIGIGFLVLVGGNPADADRTRPSSVFSVVTTVSGFRTNVIMDPSWARGLARREKIPPAVVSGCWSRR